VPIPRNLSGLHSAATSTRATRWQLATGGAHHTAQLGGGGRGAAGGARDCGAARVVHRVAQCRPRSRVLQPTVVRMGVAVVGRVRLWHTLLTRITAAVVVLKKILKQILISLICLKILHKIFVS